MYYDESQLIAVFSTGRTNGLFTIAPNNDEYSTKFMLVLIDLSDYSIRQFTQVNGFGRSACLYGTLVSGDYYLMIGGSMDLNYNTNDSSDLSYTDPAWTPGFWKWRISPDEQDFNGNKVFLVSDTYTEGNEAKAPYVDHLYFDATL